MLGQLRKKFQGMSRYSDAVLAIGVVGLVMLLIIPLPAIILDTLLSLSIVMAVMALLLTIYIENALEFSAFPSLLLFLTLYRLGLNIASTRMILTKGDGGDIIRTFGGFVTQGNTVVGLILFILLTLINFIVVTKGAGRIAEVAARFTLDALPGKQMAVDADLSSGMISHEEAKKARETINAEAEFYGSMDGASKFVRGDAIAGLVITAVNIFGGFVVGMVVKKLSWHECWTTFTRLTVGDGLVSQIPALLISVGAGIIVTRASGGSLGKTLPKQFLNNPKVLSIAAGVLVILSLIPGMPTFVMFSIAATLFLYSYVLTREKGKEKKPYSAAAKEESVEKALIIHPVEVQLGIQLVGMGEELMRKIPEIRRQVASDLGVVIPSIHISDNLTIRPKNYLIKIKGVTTASGKGSTSVILQNHLTQVAEAHAYRLLNRQDVARMVDNAKKVDSAVVDELIPHKLNLGHILKVLQNLLKERLPIRDFVSILEVLADHVTKDKTPDPDLLTEYVRQGLSRGISEHLFGDAKQIYAITFDPKVEQMVVAARQKSDYGTKIALRPKTIEKINLALSSIVEKATGKNRDPVVLTSVSSRLCLRRLLETYMPELPVLSFAEVSTEIEVKSLGTITDEVLL
ncbi:MAG: Flagellar biosynthesis protein FlhA [Chlamydiae bacterium]|nr:Flagellar biosynthesis protein FlhA [Chlamydiota bacterium]